MFRTMSLALSFISTNRVSSSCVDKRPTFDSKRDMDRPKHWAIGKGMTFNKGIACVYLN